ncbi:UDP-glucose 4-epimerase GalE [Thermomonas carbonis]|uniref:UDP-glucose 4-epimerase n=1 Tax=Thermomonas carbonis TaxID=1463158 RepID=A0A7G9STJ5_9GAMM|nr:UDP-glucose 4-epimerase GalE [Thermomonas carbonis]QNN71170.1 UDP-glucose 4-epimerase GalE [Thermomonas carbonis]GHC11493.1 UDP-glucose 4-epimerase GalE [Thermomonas carbonis]
MTDTILVTGGAGYIGSQMVKALRQAGYRPVVLDDLSSGHRNAVRGEELHVGDVGDAAFVDRVLAEVQPAAVMHFASFIQVGESVADPGKYFRNNVTATQTLLDAMRARGILRFIFSSTAAIFGDPQYVPIDEAHPKSPINPYGRSKWFVEQLLEDYDHAYGLKSVCLRYFNAAGADPDNEIGERHDPETHLVPLILQVASGRRPHIGVYGDDYPTADGTCVRDYVHVADLCDAHLLALRQLLGGAGSARYNLGNGNGFSVREVIDTARRITGHPIPVVMEPRRAGDPPSLVADAAAARAALGWTPRYADLHTIIGHAWACEQRIAAELDHARPASDTNRSS